MILRLLNLFLNYLNIKFNIPVIYLGMVDVCDFFGLNYCVRCDNLLLILATVFHETLESSCEREH